MKFSSERTPILAPLVRALLGLLLLASIVTLPAAANPCDIRYGSLCGDCDEDVGAIRSDLSKELAQSWFSSKTEDPWWGHYYYGYRFYMPELGRWLSGDPMEVWGGINTYAHVLNSPMNWVDSYGLMASYGVKGHVSTFNNASSSELVYETK